jgi:hypothetical protein
MRAILVLTLMLAVLAGCGQMPEAVPTIPLSSSPEATDGVATPASPTAGALTLGDLATRVINAWSGVTSYRSVFTAEAFAAPAPGTPVASPVASPVATPVVRMPSTIIFLREIVLPDRQRQEVTGLGANDHEAVATEDGVFLRGPLVEQIAPGTPPVTWIALDPARIPEGSVLSQLLGGLPQMPAAPLATLPQRLWPQELRDLGTVEFDGRTCQAYGAADTVAATGMRIDYTIAIDDRDLPCFIETSTGGEVQGRDEYRDIDAALEIVAPTMATPISVPPALATPISHD